MRRTGEGGGGHLLLQLPPAAALHYWGHEPFTLIQLLTCHEKQAHRLLSALQATWPHWSTGERVYRVYSLECLPTHSSERAEPATPPWPHGLMHGPRGGGGGSGRLVEKPETEAAA